MTLFSNYAFQQTITLFLNASSMEKSLEKPTEIINILGEGEEKKRNGIRQYWLELILFLIFFVVSFIEK